MKSTSRQGSFEKNLIAYRKYEYTPLSHSDGSIRLLRLHAAPGPTWPIRCSLFHTTLEEAPPYASLSYSWGERIGSQQILIDSEHIFVTPNLKHALRTLRPKPGEDDLLLWVDAVSINQEDIPERNAQTANMRAIYQHAASVIVFLGLENNDSRGAMQLARDLNACISRQQIRDLVNNQRSKGDLKAMVTLFRRQYWWRVWVIQEVSSAKSVMVYCGADSMSWRDLDKVCDQLKQVPDELQAILYKHPSFIRTLTYGGPRGLQLSRFSPHISAPPLLELLISHRSKNSTDPKDKVYALVGISDSALTFGKVDYARSIREVYTHTAQHIISSSRKLDVICVKQHDHDQFNLPSWVPDWTRPHHREGATGIGLHHYQPAFTASGDTVANVRFLGDGYVMKVSGFVIDTLHTVGVKYRKHGVQTDYAPALRALLNWWNIFVVVHGDSVAAQAIFGNTISCGRWDYEDDSEYVSKLATIFALSEKPDDPMSEPSSPSGTANMGDSVSSLLDGDGEVEDEGEDREQLSTILDAGLAMNRRRLFLSAHDLVGLAPLGAQEGDVLCVLLGCRYPVILRQQGDRYILVGEAYVDGIMFGEMMKQCDAGEYRLQDFEIH